MAPTKSAGRVSIRVLPDSTKFREDLKKTLDRIENSMKVNIKVNPVMDKSQLAELKRQIEALAITIRPDIDLTVPADDVARIKEQIEAMNPEIQVDMQLSTAGASARISALTRDRTMRIWPMVMGNSMKNIGKHLAAIAGMGYIVNEIDRGLKFLRSIDTHAINLSKQALMMGSVISAAAGAAQVLFGVGDALIKLSGLLTVAPALISSLGIATYALIVPLKNMKEELSSLAPAFNEMHAAMNRQFWNQAKEPIEEMVNHLMPTLAEKMIKASHAMGLFTAEMARSYGEHVTIERFALMFDRVLESMIMVRHAIDPLMQAFTTLGLHGTKYLTRLSMAIVRTSEKFNNWIQINDANGNLTKWTENAITSFKEFGGVIKGVWNVFGALNSAIKEAGGPSLADMHRSLDSMATMMSSPRFQAAMVSVFEGMNTAMHQIGLGIRDIGPALESMAPVAGQVFAVIGTSVREVIGYFGEIMAHPLIQHGLLKAFEGMAAGIRALKPAIEPFSVALGSLLKLLGTVLDNVGHLVATIMTEWGPSLQKLSDTFDTLAEPLRVMLEDVVKALTPAIETLIDDAIVPLLVWVRDHLIPAMSDFAEEVGPVLKDAFKVLGDAIDGLMPIMEDITDYFRKGNDSASDFKKTLDDIALFFNDPEAWMNKEHEITFKTPALGGGAGKLIGDKGVGGALAELDPVGNWIEEWFAALGRVMGEEISEWYGEVNKELESFFNRFAEGMKIEYGNLNEDLEEFWSGFGDTWENLSEGFGSAMGWPDIELKAQSAFAETKMRVEEGISEIKLAWTNFTSGEMSWGELWNGLGEAFGIDMETLNATLALGWDTLVNGGKEKLGSFATWFGETWARAVEEDKVRWEEFDIWLNEKWTALTEWGSETWGTFKENLGVIWGDIRTNIKTKLDESGVDQSNAWTIMAGFAEIGWDEIKRLVSIGVQETKDRVNTKLNELGIDMQGTWGRVKNGASVGWANIKEAVRQGMVNILNMLGFNGEEIVRNIGNAWERAKGAARDKVAEMKRVVKEKIDQIVGDIQALPGRMARALTGQSLSGSGSSLINGFAQGIANAADGAVETARGVLQRIRNLFPNSPAKEGPFSGRGWTPYSGAATADGFAEGIASRMNHARGVARKFQQGVADELSAINAPNPDGTVDTVRDGNVTLNVYNPVAEPTSRTMARNSSNILLGGMV